MSALAEALAGKIGKKLGMKMDVADEEDESAESLDSVEEACKTMCPKVDPASAAAAFKRAFAACMTEHEDETDEE